MKKTTIIHLGPVVEYTGLSKNITTQEYNRFILSVQNLQLKNELGKELVEELVSQVCENTVTESNELLILEIEPFLSFSSYAKYCGSSEIKPTRSGNKKTTGDNTTSPNKQDIGKLVDFNQREADQYLCQLIEFMEDNLNTYPLYVSRQKETSERRTIFT